MCYHLIFDITTARDLQKLPPYLKEFVKKELNKLLDSAEELGRPSVSPPYPPGSMMYSFRLGPCSRNGWHGFTIFYQRSEKDQQIRILGVGHTPYTMPTQDDMPIL